MIRKRKNQRGAALAFVCVSIVGLCGVTALAIDQGLLWNSKQRAQNLADASVLAAAQGLMTSNSSQSAATQAATSDIDANNRLSDLTFQPNATDSNGNATYVTFPTNITADDGAIYSPAPGKAVRVDGYIDTPIGFGGVIGFSPTGKDGSAGVTSVPAHAIAVITPIQSTTNAVPFGPVGDQPGSSDPTLAYLGGLMTNPPPFGSYQTTMVELKSDSNGGSSIQAAGNFGAIDLGNGNGASTYRSNIAGPSGVNVYIGETISTKTGNMVGPTQQGMSDRLASTNTDFTHYFTSYDQWFFGRPTDSNGKPFPAANPPTVTTSDGIVHNVYLDPEKQNSTDAHLAVVPFVSSPSKNGKASVTILGFGVFWIDNDAPSDGSVVTGRFIGMDVQGKGAYPSGATTGPGAYTVSLVQ